MDRVINDASEEQNTPQKTNLPYPRDVAATSSYVMDRVINDASEEQNTPQKTNPVPYPRDVAATSSYATDRVINDHNEDEEEEEEEEEDQEEEEEEEEEISDKTQLLGGGEQTRVYGRRWYVLAVFCLAAAVQGGGWATWGPITQTSKAVFSWTDGYVALQPLGGNLASVLVMVPVTWLMDVKGLRVSMIFSSFFLAVGFGLRCVTSDPAVASWLISVGQILIGIGGSVPFGGVSLLAATWFPPTQRATATAVSSIFSYLGVALSFIIGPQLVPEPPNITSIAPADGQGNMRNISEAVDITEQRDAIMRLLYYEAGLAGLVLVVVLVYFPATPPLPPCRSAAVTRTQYGAGLKALLGNGRFWVLTIAYSVPVGTYGAFGGIMDIDLNPAGISQITAGWLGFYATIGGCVAGLLASRMADIFLRRLKLLLLLLYLGAAGSLVWFCLLVLNYIPFSLPSVYAASILSGMFVNGAVPLFYESACEVTYPVAEGVTTGFLTVCNNIVGIVFFAVLFIPGIGVAWINWVLLGTVLAALPLLLLVRQQYTRIDLDTLQIEVSVPGPQPDSAPLA